MPRLPEVGQDNNTWGEVLNGFLEVSHNADGTQKANSLVCKGFLTQLGTDAPVLTAIEDTILGTWARTTTGTYTLTKTGAFTVNKTAPVDDIYIDQSDNLYKINRTDVNTITLLTYSSTDTTLLADSVLSNRFIHRSI